MANLDERTRELIALGASVTANCLPCLEYHLGKAREVGLPDDEVRGAIEVGRMVRKGAGAKIDKLAASLTEAVPAGPAAAGCGCS